MAATTAGDALVEKLIDWGVEVVFGIPGDGINGIMEALRTRQDRIRFLQVRHEEAAAFMACGYAKWTGKLGVCLATSGPGGIHLLNGLYDAKLDRAPVLAITGLQYHDLVSTFTQQDVELDKLFVDMCAYNARVMGPAHVENVVELACRTALAYRGVSHVTIPVDTQSMPVKSAPRSMRNKPGHVSDLMAESAHAPTEDQLSAAAAILNAGQKVCIMAGQGALRAGPELAAVAERLAAPVATALLGRGALPDEHPHATGGVGLIGTRPSQDAIEGCDTFLIVGSTMPYIEYYPKPGQARAVQVDRDPQRIGLRYPVEAALVGDSARTLRALLPLLAQKADRSFLEQAQKGMEAWRDLMEERGTRRDTPMKPQVVPHELSRLLAPDAIVATDSGTITGWTARHVTMRPGMMFSCSGTLASMACGLPYAMAAKVAYPDRQVVAVVGDGGMTMLMGELATCAKYGLDVKIVVLKNNSLGQIKWEQMVFLGNPEYGCDLQDIDFAGVARACGAVGLTVDDPARCADVLRQALATPGPVVVDCVVDPHEPPMPPKITVDQAAKMAESLARGTPERGKVAMTLVSNTLRELV